MYRLNVLELLDVDFWVLRGIFNNENNLNDRFDFHIGIDKGCSKHELADTFRAWAERLENFENGGGYGR